MKERIRKDTTASNCNGFTLIEVLISLVITMIVMGAVFGLLTRGQQSFESEPERVDMQQNARTALSKVTNDVTVAGAGLPPEFPSFTPTAFDPTVGDLNPDVIEITRAVEMTGGVGAPEPIPVTSPTGDWLSYQVICPASPCTTPLKNGDLVVVYVEPLPFDVDPQPQVFWTMGYLQADPVGDPATFFIGSSPTVPGKGPIPPAYDYSGRTDGARAFRTPAFAVPVSVVRYFTQPDTSNLYSIPPLVLMRQEDFGTPAPISFVEDFQVTYLVGNDPAIEQDTPPVLVTLDRTVMPTDIVSSIRITVAGRSLRENVAGATQAAGEIGSLLRTSYSSNASPRNISGALTMRYYENPQRYPGGLPYQ